MLIVIATEGKCELLQGIDCYVMRGPTGEHRIMREASRTLDLERRDAHWRGFLQQNNEPVPPASAPQTLREFIEEVRDLSRANLKAAQRHYGGYCRARELSLTASKRGSNIGDADYVSASKLTQKFLRETVKRFAERGADEFFVDVGADWFESFKSFLDGDIHDPSVETDCLRIPSHLVQEMLK